MTNLLNSVDFFLFLWFYFLTLLNFILDNKYFFKKTTLFQELFFLNNKFLDV